MRALILLLVVAAGCAQTPAKDYDRCKRELDMEEKGETPLWATIDHPIAMGYGGGGLGTLSYKTSGTGAPNRNERVDANLYRVGFTGPAGFMIDWMRSTEDMTSGTSADAFDIFGFVNRPMWPNRRLRFQGRPGGYWEKFNLKGARNGDLEGWTLGFRFEGEAEVDVVKARRFNFSLFANGRLGGGWGDYKRTGTGSQRGTSWGYGWEAGARIQAYRFFASLSWIDRSTTLDPNASGSAEYGFEGGVLAIGLRW